MKIKAKQYAQSLFDFMKKNNDLDKYEEVVAIFEKMCDQQNHTLEIEVVSARKLDEKQLENIKDFVSKKYKADEFVLKNVVDENIIGGICLKIGDEMIDLSVGKQLKDLKKKLKG